MQTEVILKYKNIRVILVKMIEVEVRGRLDVEEYEKLKEFLSKNGEFLGHKKREMYLLRGHPGHSHDPLAREMDVRLRNTDGECEIMFKRKAGNKNIGREEISLKLKDKNLEVAKLAVKALGYGTAIKMHRVMDIYEYDSIRWQVVKTPKDYFYFEAELETENENEVDEMHAAIAKKARSLGLNVLTPEETRDFLYLLDREVNEEVRF